MHLKAVAFFYQYGIMWKTWLFLLFETRVNETVTFTYFMIFHCTLLSLYTFDSSALYFAHLTTVYFIALPYITELTLPVASQYFANNDGAKTMMKSSANQILCHA